MSRPWVPNLWKAGIPVLVAVVVYFLPVPEGVEPTGMRMLAIFLGTILALILQPLPTGAVALIGMAAAMLTKTESAARALAGFANATVWLIVAAFFIAEGFLITGSRLEDSHPEPEESRKRVGAFLTLTALQVNVVTSPMFLTAGGRRPGHRDILGQTGFGGDRARTGEPDRRPVGDVEALPAHRHDVVPR